MRREFVMVGVFLLFSFSLVAAATCDDDQTIMRLYASTNSHVSAWNQSVGTYVEEICYDDVFGRAHTGSNSHDCDGSNRVLSLNGSSNSHASNVNDTNYNYDVCFGDLECVYDSSAGTSCSNDGKIVARMFSGTNSHVSGVTDTNYPMKICCNSAGVYWADMMGNQISETEIGDSVLLIESGGVSGVFEVKENDWLSDDEIISITGEARGSDWAGIWSIANEDMLLADDIFEDFEEFYFEINGETSEYLNISKIGDDDPMNITIVSPDCGDYFNESVVATIEVTAVDSDDLITGTVTFDGEQIIFGNGGVKFNKTLDTPGNFQVLVEAFNTQGERSRIISNIMVLDLDSGAYVDGEYVAACIDKPKDFEDIDGSIIDFDASSTRGIRADGGDLEFLDPSNGDVFSWYWTFYPEEIQRNYIDSTDTLAYKFTAEFPIAGDNSASLRVEI